MKAYFDKENINKKIFRGNNILNKNSVFINFKINF